MAQYPIGLHNLGILFVSRFVRRMIWHAKCNLAVCNMSGRFSSYNYLAKWLALIIVLALPAFRAEAFTPQTKAGKAQPTTWKGCVDEQSGQYVLLDDRSLSPVADLAADGFPTEGFAKYVGQKVTVVGSSTPGANRPLIKVRNIQTVSESCTPQSQ